MRKTTKIVAYIGIFLLFFLASALVRISLLGSAPERLIKDKTQDQYLILYIHGGSFNSGSKEDGETWCKYYAAQGYITAFKKSNDRKSGN